MTYFVRVNENSGSAGKMILVLDTTFLILHYFSDDEAVLAKTREGLRISRKLGNKGILPTIVLAEFYAQTYKRTGRDVADKYFREIVNSGLDIASLTQEVSYQAGLLRAKYQEKVPWGDCIVAATALLNKAKFVVTEDPHFTKISEIEVRRTSQLRL
ncbi:PIN domain-containing protein [Candidatus Bathyarchaeota archaeon]|nr:PIN domain-containing protein [Candidatus Bathyarchaeota archaeon]